MIANRLLILLLILWPATISLPAMEADTLVYTTDRLAAMGRQLGLRPPLDDNNSLMSYNGLPLTLRTDSENRVNHIGYSLFGELRRNPEMAPALDFVERYTLEASLPLPRMKTLAKQLLEDDVTLHGCTLATLPAMSTDSTLSVRVENLQGRRYRVSWLRGTENSHSIEFPLSHDLLSGCDIDENERRLPPEIMNFKTTLDLSSPPELSIDETIGLYVTPSGNYFVDGLTSARYYEDYEGEFEPLYDLDFPAHTAANLFTGTDLENGFDLDVKFRKYNYMTERFTVPVSQLVGYFISQGCQPYFGVIKLAEGEIIGESLFVNERMGYCHAMKISMREHDLIDRGGVIQARLVSYIPVSKISNIFDEFK